jgi:Mrp family chromosome partitioning ATPase
VQVSSIRDVTYRVPIVRGPRGTDQFRTLDVVTAGPIPPNPSDLIESDALHRLVKQAEKDYDLVVVDTPPASVVSDAIPLVAYVSGVIVVCRLGKTTRDAATHLHNQLTQLNASLLGVVVNSVGRQAGRYGYGYGYGYGPRDGSGYLDDDGLVEVSPSDVELPEPTLVAAGSTNGHGARAAGHSERLDPERR